MSDGCGAAPPCRLPSVSPSVSLSGATLCRFGAPLFQDLTLTLEGGRWTCLLGPSGIGKTSLLRLLAGLESGAGATRLVADDGRPLQGRVAWMAQQDLLLPWLSVRDNVLLGARLRGQRLDAGVRGRAQALIAAVGLTERASARPDQLSGGMRQRAALARTLMEDRPLVLMDEPFSALDPASRERLQTLAATLLAGRTVLQVTHDPAEALRLADTVLVLSGSPARLGPPLRPPGPAPRGPGGAELLPLRLALLEQLSA